MTYDWDPELFTAFLCKFPLTFRELKDNIVLAVNHDTNIECIIEKGLARLDLERKMHQKSEATMTSVAIGQENVLSAPESMLTYREGTNDETQRSAAGDDSKSEESADDVTTPAISSPEVVITEAEVHAAHPEAYDEAGSQAAATNAEVVYGGSDMSALMTTGTGEQATINIELQVIQPQSDSVEDQHNIDAVPV